MNYFGIEVGKILTGSLIHFLITLIVGSILLHLATGLLGFKKRSFTKAASTVLMGDILAFFLRFIPLIGPLMGLIGFWFIIKKMYDIGWIKSILAWLMSIFVAFIISVIILLFLGMSIMLFI